MTGRIHTRTSPVPRETTTLGLRRYTLRKSHLDREIIEVMTKAHVDWFYRWADTHEDQSNALSSGEVSVKTGLIGGKAVKFGPEYEDCRELSSGTGIPLHDIYTEASHLARTRRR